MRDLVAPSLSLCTFRLNHFGNKNKFCACQHFHWRRCFYGCLMTCRTRTHTQARANANIVITVAGSACFFSPKSFLSHAASWFLTCTTFKCSSVRCGSSAVAAVAAAQHLQILCHCRQQNDTPHTFDSLSHTHTHTLLTTHICICMFV